MIKIAPRIKIAPNARKSPKTSQKVQKCSKSSKTPENVQKRSKCFPAATEPQDLCRSRRQPRGPPLSAAVAAAAAARLRPQELSFSKRHYFEGACFPVGGSGEIAKALCESIAAEGGQVFVPVLPPPWQKT